jgi:hypothetical protein
METSKQYARIEKTVIFYLRPTTLSPKSFTLQNENVSQEERAEREPDARQCSISPSRLASSKISSGISGSRESRGIPALNSSIFCSISWRVTGSD